MNILITLTGICLLLAGGEGLVRGAVGIARRMGISPFIVGLTIVGFGTSAPELVVSVDAALAGSPGIAVGNVIGSNMANMMLIIGTAAVFCPLAVHPDALRRDSVVMVGATVLFVVVAFSGTMARLVGAVLVGALILYLALSLWWDSRQAGPAAALHRDEAEEVAVVLPQRLWILITAIFVGLGALIAGSGLAVTGATALARDAGISEEIIGITLIAVGTSLPELVTALVAAKRGHADVCIGNVIGSNIFNLLGVAGAAAIAAPLSFELDIIRYDLSALLAVTGIFIAFMMTGRRIERWEGAGLLLLYAAYVTHHLLPGGIIAVFTGGP
ncbi:MAG: calcium/sodium antiporter [Proteobacteria bacterium]|nr:calcium/sodium antiporter [Pseudomonadota bacterium]